jgi:hypothetical protein
MTLATPFLEYPSMVMCSTIIAQKKTKRWSNNLVAKSGIWDMVIEQDAGRDI